MTLAKLIEQLLLLANDPMIGGDSPVIVEGWNHDGEYLQGVIASVSTEARCEDDDENQAVYLNLASEVDGECMQDCDALDVQCSKTSLPGSASGGGT